MNSHQLLVSSEEASLIRSASKGKAFPTRLSQEQCVNYFNGFQKAGKTQTMQQLQQSYLVTLTKSAIKDIRSWCLRRIKVGRSNPHIDKIYRDLEDFE